jgi:ubiquinone/menaquinone biosynthesis C-methylase UbiE
LSWIVELDNPFAKAHKAQSIIDALEIKKHMRILDIGCGPGRVLIPLANELQKKNGHITGIDIQLAMIEKTKKKIQDLEISNVDFIHGSLEEQKLDQDKFDAILLICVLGEIPKSKRNNVIRKIKDCLSPNGIVSITETVFDPHFQSRKKVISLMNNEGLVVKKSVGNCFAYTLHFGLGDSKP